MKTILLFFAATIAFVSAKAQFSQNFEGSESSLTANCWTLSQVYKTTTVGDVITGTGSLYTNPPTNGSSTRDILTPALNITSVSFTVSFNYKVSSKINGNATRTIEVGLLTPDSVFTSLSFISLDKNSPVTVMNFNQTFTLTSTGVRKLVLKLGGSTGDGNSRLIIDDLYESASAFYGPSSTCNSAPVAVDDIFQGTKGSPITGNVLANDNEPNGEAMKSSIVITSADGAVVLNQNGNFTFTPNAGFIGNSTTFTYQISDNGFAPLSSNTATVTLNFSNPISLPVKLISFNAMLNNNKVNLKWVTATEMNADHFIIEKSTDGRTFSDAGVVFAYGNTTEQKNYQYTDNISSSNNAVIYYRLRQVDIDGKSEYSETRIIRLSKQTENAITVLTYPNPVSNELRITIPNNWQNKKVTYEMFNSNGQVSKKSETTNSSQTENLNVSSLAPGFYIVKVTCDGQFAQQRIIKQ